jgi:nucleoside-diphosphate-sugar epimerase
MTDAQLAAHDDGLVEVAIGRASDYFGPGTTQSALGEALFDAVRRGRRAQVLGDPDALHSYSYTPDVAAALITLGTATAAVGEVWHLPVAETRTTREVVARLAALNGTSPRIVAAGPVALRAAGLVMPALRELRHTLYQFQQRWVVDDAKYRAAFAADVTPLDDALAATVEWFATTPDPTPSTHQGAHR